MMNAMFMLLNSIEARSRFGRTITALGENSPRETEFSHEQFPFHLDGTFDNKDCHLAFSFPCYRSPVEFLVIVLLSS